GLAWADLSGGRFVLGEVDGEDALAAELARLAPAETLVGEDGAWPACVTALPGLRRRAPWHFDAATARRELARFFCTRDLSGFGCDGLDLASGAAGCLLGYVGETEQSSQPHVTSLGIEQAGDTIALDAATRRNLELDAHPGGRIEHTLLGILDATVTPMGARALRRWLHRPLRDRQVLERRYQALESLADARRHEALREVLRGVGDLERILARVALRSARPRDLSTLRDGLALAKTIRAIFPDRENREAAIHDRTLPTDSPLLADLVAGFGDHAATVAHLAAAVVESPPALQRDGGVIREGFDAELDELRTLSTDADRFLLELEQREKAATGIANLRVGYN